MPETSGHDKGDGGDLGLEEATATENIFGSDDDDEEGLLFCLFGEKKL
jgi:hypothetical protein